MSAEATDKLDKYQRTTLTDDMIRLAEKTGRKTSRRIAKQTKALTGRPTALTPLTALRIIEMILEGNRPRAACASVGITKRTFDTWKARAREWMEREEFDGDLEKVPEHERIFVEFTLMVEAAEGEAERLMLKKALSGKRGWQAAVAVLERRFSGGWSKENVHRHEVGGGERPIVIEIETDQERAAGVAHVLNEAGVIDGTDSAREITERSGAAENQVEEQVETPG
jgi:hypothetical protein